MLTIMFFHLNVSEARASCRTMNLVEIARKLWHGSMVDRDTA